MELSAAQISLIDEIRSRFAEDLRRGEQPWIETYLADVDETLRRPLLRALLEVELEFSSGRGEKKLSRETYRARFASHTKVVDALFDEKFAGVGDTEHYATSNTKNSLSDAPADGNAPPQEFKNYVLIREIARGGMGVVYEARQSGLDRTVALKMIITRGSPHPEDVERFYIEAQAVARLDHPNIVPVFEIGEHDGRHFYAMAYVDGESLAERIRRAPISSRETADLIAPVTDAIAYAHDNGIVHRDLKPANILLERGGAAKVTDFGIAKRMDDEAGLTATGQVLGTPNYMPPEQASGDIAQVGPAADVYSLGAVLYHMLTGRPPFQSASIADILTQVIDREPLPPRALDESIDRDLETICLKCLEKKPSQRYESAKDLAAELRRYLAGAPIHARPIGKIGRAWKWCRNNPVVAGLLAVVFLTFSAGTVVSTYFAVLAESRHRISRAERTHRSRTDATGPRYADDGHLRRQ